MYFLILFSPHQIRGSAVLRNFQDQVGIRHTAQHLKRRYIFVFCCFMSCVCLLILLQVVLLFSPLAVHYGADLATPINIDTSLRSRNDVSDQLWGFVSTEW